MTRSGFRLLLLLGLFPALPLLAQDLTQPYVEGQVLIRFEPGLAAADRAAVRGALLPTGSQEIGLVPGLELVQTRLSVTQAIAVLGNNPNVMYIEPDYILQPEVMPNDYYTLLEWGLHNSGQDIRGVLGTPDADIDMPEAWDISGLVAPGAGTVVVAVIDSGTQLDHEDLWQNIWVNPNEIAGNGIDDDGNGFIDDVNGWDFFANDNDPSDESGHGTHTAGTIGAVTNNGIGVAGVCGNACKIMPLRFLGPQGGPTSAAVMALQYAINQNVKVSNNSWGGGGYSQSLVNAIAAAGDIGHVFVTSAGNSGINTDVTPHYPGSYDNWNIISVAATTNEDLLAYFSNFGATTVDIGAPGFDVASTYMGNAYWWMSGTSMATPHVAGVVALVQGSEPGLSAQQVISRIYATARPLAALSGLTTTGAMLNAHDALDAGATEPNSPPSVSILSGGGSYKEGDSVQLTATASDAKDGDLTASIAWLLNGSPTGELGGTYNAGVLAVGTHTVTAEVTDSDDNTRSSSASVTVAADAPPSVSITSGGGIYTEGDSVQLTATASDNENGDLTGAIAWLLDGAPTSATGGTYDAGALAVGSYNVTAEVTDSYGHTTTDSTSVTVEADTTSPSPTTPLAPEWLSATDQGDGSAVLVWQMNPESDAATSFIIERQELKTNGRYAGTWTGSTTFTVYASPYTDSPGAKTVQYRIAAVNDAGTSGMSGWIEVIVTDSGGGGGGSGGGNCRPKKNC